MSALQVVDAACKELLSTRPNTDAMARFFLALVVAAGAAGASGLTGVIIVDGTNGDDATGTRGSFMPFRTVQAALNVAQATDYVWITPGSYAGPITLPAVNNLTLMGLSPATGAVTLTASSAQDTLSLLTGVTINGLVLENLTLSNSSAGQALSIGSSAVTRFDSGGEGLVLRNITASKVKLENLGTVNVYDSIISTSLDERGCGKVTYNNSSITGYIQHYLDATSSTQPTSTGRVGTFFRNCRCSTSFVLSGAVSTDIDADTILFCQLNASALSPNVVGALDPWLRCTALIGNGSNANFVINDAFTGINIGFANVAWQTAPAAGAAGFDLSGCRCYGKAFIEFLFDLNAVVLDVKKYQFACTNAFIADDLTVKQTPALAGAQRYYISFRNCQLGTPGQVGVQAGSPTVQADRCDLDIRGSTRQNVVLSAVNAGTIDRDYAFKKGQVCGAGATLLTFAANFTAEPPFPAGATINVITTQAVALAGAQAGDLPVVSADTAAGFTLTSVAGTTVNITVLRGPNLACDRLSGLRSARRGVVRRGARHRPLLAPAAEPHPGARPGQRDHGHGRRHRLGHHRPHRGAALGVEPPGAGGRALRRPAGTHPEHALARAAHPERHDRHAPPGPLHGERLRAPAARTHADQGLLEHGRRLARGAVQRPLLVPLPEQRLARGGHRQPRHAALARAPGAAHHPGRSRHHRGGGRRGHRHRSPRQRGALHPGAGCRGGGRSGHRDRRGQRQLRYERL